MFLTNLIVWYQDRCHNTKRSQFFPRVYSSLFLFKIIPLILPNFSYFFLLIVITFVSTLPSFSKNPPLWSVLLILPTSWFCITFKLITCCTFSPSKSCIYFCIFGVKDFLRCNCPSAFTVINQFLTSIIDFKLVLVINVCTINS